MACSGGPGSRSEPPRTRQLSHAVPFLRLNPHVDCAGRGWFAGRSPRGPRACGGRQKTGDGLVCGRRGPCESVSTGRDRPDHARSRYERRGCTPSRDIDTHRDGRSCARGARCTAVPGQSRGETEGVFAARRAQVLASIEEMRRGVRSALQLDPEVESWTFVSTLPTVCQSRSSRDLFF